MGAARAGAAGRAPGREGAPFGAPAAARAGEELGEQDGEHDLARHLARLPADHEQAHQHRCDTLEAVPDALERYLELTRETLPERARAEGWVVRDDHCFQRIVLDHVAGGCWYDAIARPAYRHLTPAQAEHAAGLAERIAAEGDPLLRELNERSKAWRRGRRAS